MWARSTWFCVWVVQHLSEPARGLRNLVRNLAEDGVLFVYIYGKHRTRERMRRKKITSLLLHGKRADFDLGIQIVKDLGFDNFDFDYGWNLNFDDAASQDALIVDAYLNVNDNLYADDVFHLVGTRDFRDSPVTRWRSKARDASSTRGSSRRAARSWM